MWRRGVWAGSSTTKVQQQIMLEKHAGGWPPVQELNGLCSESGRRQVSLLMELLLQKSIEMSMSNLKMISCYDGTCNLIRSNSIQEFRNSCRVSGMQD